MNKWLSPLLKDPDFNGLLKHFSVFSRSLPLCDEVFLILTATTQEVLWVWNFREKQLILIFF